MSKITISRVDILKAYLIFILCGWYMNTVDAQSQCNAENSEQGSIIECDMSFTFLITAGGGAVASNAWSPDDVEKNEMNERFNEFSRIWCLANAGHSKIGKISVFTDGTNADFWLVSQLRRSGLAVLGGFTYVKPSSYIHTGAFGNAMGVTIAHEYAHSAFKIMDEYKQPGGVGFCRPSEFHQSRSTLMGSSSNSLRFSYSADYPRRQNIQTAHYECYGKSAWEVMTQSAYRDDPRNPNLTTSHPRRDYFFQLGIGIPDAAQLAAVPGFEDFKAANFNSIYSCPAPIINWVSTGTTVVMAMDHSASMDDNQRLSIAKAAAKEMIDLVYAERVPMELAIVGFDDVPRTEATPTRPDNIENVRMLGSVIDSFVADGSTDYEAALEHVHTVFNNANSDGHKLLIVISDGETEPPDFNYFKNNNISVYTVELDTEGKVSLQDAVTRTRSRFNMKVDAQRLNSFIPRMLRDASVLRNDQLAKSISFDNHFFDDVVTTATIISKQTEAASFILRWDDDAVFGSFTLRDPDGVVINPIDADTSDTDDIGYWEGRSQAIYYVASPVSGIWRMFVMGTGNFEYEVAVSSGITADINAGAEIISQETPNERVMYPEPIPILVRVGDASPILYADVMAKVTMPDDSTMSLRLMDDGNAPDEWAQDGLYSGMLADYSEDGICEIQVTVSNPEDKAIYGESRLADHGPNDIQVQNTPIIPTPAPRFERVVYDQVDVMNTKEKFMPPPLSVQPTTITTIPYLDKGSIEQAGQMHWYLFNSMEEGKRYYIQTSNLMGYDDTPMVTEVSLYEADGEDVIETSVRYRGSDVSSIEWLAPRAADYLVSVAHAEGGRGYYEFTVSEENLLSEPQMAEAERRSRSGGFVGYPLLLLLLFTAVMLFHRTIRV